MEAKPSGCEQERNIHPRLIIVSHKFQSADGGTNNRKFTQASNRGYLTQEQQMAATTINTSENDMEQHHNPKRIHYSSSKVEPQKPSMITFPKPLTIHMSTASNVNARDDDVRCLLDSVRDLNNAGVDACRCASLRTDELTTKHNLPQTSSHPFFQCALKLLNETNLLDVLATDTSASDKDQPKICHRSEYDEGMATYSSLIPLRSSDTELQWFLIVVTFNVGQVVFLRGGAHDDEAERCFQRALLHTQSLIANRTETKKSSLEASEVMIAILHSIALVHYRNGKHADAMKCYEEALAAAKSLGPSHAHHVASTLNCMGVIQFHLQNGSSDDNGILQYFMEALHIRQRWVAARGLTCNYDRELATIMNNIGRTHFMYADYSGALRAYEQALVIRKLIFEANHLDIGAVVFNMGQTYHHLNMLDSAEIFYENFLRILTANKMTTKHHRDVASVLKCIARVCHDRGDLDRALITYNDALHVGRAALGNNHPEVAATLNKLGNVKYEMNDLDGALQLYKEGLRIERATLDKNHPNIAVTLGNIARVHKIKGEHNLALLRYQEVLRIQKSGDPQDSLGVASTLHNIGLSLYQLSEYAEAFDKYQEALCIRREHYGDDHLEVSATLNSIGLALFKQGLTEFALSAFEECLRIRREVLGKNHRDVAVVLFNMATTLLDRGDDDEAMHYYLETLRVERLAFRPDHPDVVMTTQHIGQIYVDRGDLKTAIQYFEEALRMVERIFGAKSRELARSLNHLGNLHLQLGRAEEVMEYFARAQRIFNEHNCRAENEEEEESVVASGFDLYDMSKLHPESAAAA